MEGHGRTVDYVDAKFVLNLIATLHFDHQPYVLQLHVAGDNKEKRQEQRVALVQCDVYFCMVGLFRR